MDRSSLCGALRAAALCAQPGGDLTVSAGWEHPQTVAYVWREARMAPQTRAKLVAEIAKLWGQQSDDLAEGCSAVGRSNKRLSIENAPTVSNS